MILRAVPFAISLLWLAYESHFSPAFFLSTAGHGLASLMGGKEDMSVAERSGQSKDKPAIVKTASANNGRF